MSWKLNTVKKAAKEIAFDDAVEGAALDGQRLKTEIVELPAEAEDEVHRAMNEFMGNMQSQGISPKCTSKYWYNLKIFTNNMKLTSNVWKTNLVIEAVAAAGSDATEEEN